MSPCKNPPADCLSVFQSMQVPWEDLCYLFGEIMYGGHITDDWDRRLCKTYLQEFMHPKMVSREFRLPVWNRLTTTQLLCMICQIQSQSVCAK